MFDFLGEIPDKQFWSMCMVLLPMSVLFAVIYFVSGRESK